MDSSGINGDGAIFTVIFLSTGRGINIISFSFRTGITNETGRTYLIFGPLGARGCLRHGQS